MVTRAIVAGCCVVWLSGCGGPIGDGAPMGMVFLTRDDCVNAGGMRTNLDAALTAMGLSTDYQVIDIAELPDDDVRRGYPTPTVLYANRDLFGLSVPTAPLPAPA